MMFNVPYFLLLITSCYASINSHKNIHALKPGANDVFDSGVCFQEATCESVKNGQNATCFGTELPYSTTSLALAEDSKSQFDVQDNLALWQGLRSIPRCWAVVQPLLCAVYMPKCVNGSVSLPSQEMCRITRGPCKAVVIKDNWPSFLQCENKQLFPQHCKNPLQEIKFNTSYKCIPPLVETNHAENWFEEVEGCGIQCQDPFYTEKEHDQAHNIIFVLALLSFFANTFTVVTFIINWRATNHYPGKMVFYINVYLLLAMIGWLMQFIPGAREEIVCNNDGTIRRQQPKLGQHLCIFSFLLTYACLLAAIFWCVILMYALHIQFQKTGSAKEILAKKAVGFHISALGLPTIISALIFSIKEIDGDSMSGICFVGYNNFHARVWFVLLPVGFATFVAGCFLTSVFYNLIKVKREEVANEKSWKKLCNVRVKMGIFSVCTVFLIICTFACHAYDFKNRTEWTESLWDYVVCLARNSAQPNSESSVANCSLKSRPNVIMLHLHLFCMFSFAVMMSSWSWTRASINAWKRFFSRKICRPCAAPEESPRLKKHELIAKAFEKRHQINQGRLSLSLNSYNEDLVGMNLDRSSISSRDLSSSWTMALPQFIMRRNAVGNIPPFIPRHYSSASDISHHISVDSFNQQTIDSLSLQNSEKDYVLRHPRRKTRKERERLLKTNRFTSWFPGNRRGSDTSLQSSLMAASIARAVAAKNLSVKVTKSTSTTDLGSQLLLAPSSVLPPVMLPQPSNRNTVQREAVKIPFTHGMTDNSHRLECRNLASSVSASNVSQRFTPNPPVIGMQNPQTQVVQNPLNNLLRPTIYGQGYDFMNTMYFGYMYPPMNAVYASYSTDFNYSPCGTMSYVPFSSYPNNNSVSNQYQQNLLPLHPRVDSASETEYLPIVMSDSEFTDAGHRSYDEAHLMTTQRLQRLMQERATQVAVQHEPMQPKPGLEPQACAKTQFLKRMDSCNMKAKTAATSPSRPPSGRRSPHSEAPPPSPADSLKSMDIGDDDVFEYPVNSEKEPSVASLPQELEKKGILQKIKSKFLRPSSRTKNSPDHQEDLELVAKPCSSSLGNLSADNDTTPQKNIQKEKCLDPSENVSLMDAKDGNENVSR